MHVLAELWAMGGDKIDGPLAIMRILPVLIDAFIGRPTGAAERPGAGNVGVDCVVPVTVPVLYVSSDSVQALFGLTLYRLRKAKCDTRFPSRHRWRTP